MSKPYRQWICRILLAFGFGVAIGFYLMAAGYAVSLLNRSVGLISIAIICILVFLITVFIWTRPAASLDWWTWPFGVFSAFGTSCVFGVIFADGKMPEIESFVFGTLLFMIPWIIGRFIYMSIKSHD